MLFRSNKYILSNKLNTKLALIFFSFSLLVIAPNFIGSAKYWTEVRSNDYKRVLNAANIWPKDEYKYWTVILALGNYTNRVEEQFLKPYTPAQQEEIRKSQLISLNLAKKAVNEIPNSVHLWRLYAKNPLIEDIEKTKAIAKIKFLDPYNPNI